MLKPAADAWFDRLARGRVIAVLAGLFVLFSALMRPLTLDLKERSGVAIPDALPGHDAGHLTEVFRDYGVDGLAVYRRLANCDAVFPVIYALLLAAVLHRMWRNSALRRLAWLPLLAGAVDTIENRNLRVIVAGLPSVDTSLARTTGILVAVKFTLLALTLVVIGWGALRRGLASAHRREEPRT